MVESLIIADLTSRANRNKWINLVKKMVTKPYIDFKFNTAIYNLNCAYEVVLKSHFHIEVWFYIPTHKRITSDQYRMVEI